MIILPIIYTIISLITFILPWIKLDHNHDPVNATERSTMDHDRYLRKTKFDLQSIVFDLWAIGVALRKSAIGLQPLEDKLQVTALDPPEIVAYLYRKQFISEIVVGPGKSSVVPGYKTCIMPKSGWGKQRRETVQHHFSNA